jgi:lysophospholipase L1-like esterase
MKLNRFTVFACLLLCFWQVPVLSQQNSPRLYSDPARYHDAMAAFAEADKISPPAAGSIVFVGSSSIRRWSTLVEDMAPLTALNRGFGGSNMRDAVHNIDAAVLKYKPRAVVLYEGDNDLSSFGATPDMVMEAFEDFYKALHSALPDSRLYVLSIKPSLSRTQEWPAMQATNKRLASICQNKSNCLYIDVATPMFLEDGSLSESLFVSDLLHMTPTGYDIWTTAIKPILLKHELAFEKAD